MAPSAGWHVQRRRLDSNVRAFAAESLKPELFASRPLEDVSQQFVEPGISDQFEQESPFKTSAAKSMALRKGPVQKVSANRDRRPGRPRPCPTESASRAPIRSGKLAAICFFLQLDGAAGSDCSNRPVRPTNRQWAGLSSASRKTFREQFQPSNAQAEERGNDGPRSRARVARAGGGQIRWRTCAAPVSPAGRVSVYRRRIK